jgi:hypothetical protein
MHRQTTAYHPESNGAVERLHRRLKDVLCACTTAATWAEKIPWVLLSLLAQLREDTGLSPLRHFLVLQLFCQMKFSKEMKFLLTQFKTFYFIFGCSRVFCAQAQFELPAAKQAPG